MVSDRKPRRDRSRCVATMSSFILAMLVIAGALAYTFQIGALTGRKDAEAQGYSAAYPNDTSKQIADCWNMTDRATAQKCVEDAIDASREAQRSEADLSMQRQMSDWAFWALVVGIVMAFITTIGTYLIFRQVELTRRAVEETGDATEEMRAANVIAARASDAAHDANRPWLDIIVDFGDSGNFTWIGDVCTIPISLSAKNHGPSPAVMAEISTTVVCAESDIAIAVQNAIESAKEVRGIFPVSVFADQSTIPRIWSVEFNPSGVPANYNMVLPHIVASAAYGIPGSIDRKVIVRVYSVIDASNSGALIKEKCPIPIWRLSMSENITHGGYMT